MSIDLHRDAVVVDCHNDLILLIARDRELGLVDSVRERWIPQLRSGGVDVQVVPIYIQDEYLPEGALRRTLTLISILRQEVQANSDDLALCGDGNEIEAALSQNKIALILAFEGSAGIENPDLLELFFHLGLRMASFSWFGRTALADGSGEESAGGRLTRAGIEVLTEMERLGIVMDVSHLSERGVEHVIELATRPVIASHSSARAVLDHHRNLRDEQLRAIASTGGVVGVNFFPGFVDPDNPTVDRLVDHIDHIAEVAGIDHVGIGPDFVKEYLDEFYPNHQDMKIEGLSIGQTLDGLVTPADLPVLTETLLRRGFSEKDVQKVLGGNFMRVFSEVMGRPG